MKKPSRDPSLLAQGSTEAISARLEEMERKIERLRSMYEIFFSGAERQAPNAPRRELNRLMLEVQQIHINNAALRFRFQSLSQKWTLMTTYWNRTLREIESGTYRKDVAKVSRRLAQKGVPLSEQEAIALGIPAGRARALVAKQTAAQTRPAGGPAARGPASMTGAMTAADAADAGPAATGLASTQAAPAAPAAPTAGPTPEAPPTPGASAPPPRKGPPPIPRGAGGAPRAAGPSVPGMSDEEVVALHRRFDEAARGTDQPAPSLARLKEQLARHAPAAMAQLGTKDLTFDVAVKDGRVVLRPKPRK